MRGMLLTSMLVGVLPAQEPAPSAGLLAGKPLAHWIDLLQKGQWYEGRQALDVLGAAGAAARPAIAAIVGALDEPRLRPQAIQVLTGLGADAEPALPALERLLERSESRLAAIAAIGAIGPAAAASAPRIRRYAADPEARGVVLTALISIGGDVLPILRDDLRRGGAEREDALARIAAIGPPARKLAPELLKILDWQPTLRGVPTPSGATRAAAEAARLARFAELTEEARRQRAAAAKALGAIGPQGHHELSKLSDATFDEDDRVAQAAIWALSRAGQAAVMDFVKLLRQQPERHADLVLTALELLGPQAAEALPVLKDLARKDKPPAQQAGRVIVTIERSLQLLDEARLGATAERVFAAESLVVHGGAATDALLSVLRGDDRDCLLAVLKKLAQAEPSPFRADAVAFPTIAAPALPVEPFLPVLRQHLAAPEEEIVTLAVQTLAGIGLPAAAPLLADLEAVVRGGSRDPGLRIAALATLAAWHRMPEPDAELLAELVGMIVRGQRATMALELLATYGPRANGAAGPLIDLFADAERDRLPISQILIGMGADAVAPLITSLRSTDANIRAWCAFTLGQLGSTAVDAVDALQQALNDQQQNVRDAASKALAEIRR